MIRINLLPFRAAKKRENIRMQISVYVLSVVLLVAVLGFSFMSLAKELDDLRAESSRLKKDLDSYSEMLKKMEALTKKREDLKGKLEVIQRLDARRMGPVQLFDEIAMAVPKGKLFLNSLGELKGEVKMAGVAVDYDTVALFMTNLEKTETIEIVTLGGTDRSDEDGQTVSKFNLVCKLKKDDDKKSEEGKVKGGAPKSAKKKQ